MFDNSHRDTKSNLLMSRRSATVGRSILGTRRPPSDNNHAHYKRPLGVIII